MRRDVLKLLHDMREAASSIQEYIAGLDEPAFDANKAIRRAVEREFEIIGEALRRLSTMHPDVAARFPQAPKVIGFRNVLAHGYDAVENERVWRTASSDIPPLLTLLSSLIREESEG
jgi:uncharacterized protein with HEPN domain